MSSRRIIIQAFKPPLISPHVLSLFTCHSHALSLTTCHSQILLAKMEMTIRAKPADINCFLRTLRPDLRVTCKFRISGHINYPIFVKSASFLASILDAVAPSETLEIEILSDEVSALKCKGTPQFIKSNLNMEQSGNRIQLRVPVITIPVTTLMSCVENIHLRPNEDLALVLSNLPWSESKGPTTCSETPESSKRINVSESTTQESQISSSAVAFLSELSSDLTIQYVQNLSRDLQLGCRLIGHPTEDTLNGTFTFEFTKTQEATMVRAPPFVQRLKSLIVSLANLQITAVSRTDKI